MSYTKRSAYLSEKEIMKRTRLVLSIALIGVMPAAFARTPSNNFPANSSQARTRALSALAADHGGGLVPLAAEAKSDALMEPVKSVYDNYIKLQAALASDSIKGIPEAAAAIAKAVRSDSMKMLPAKVADQADKVAKANTIKVAREEFKSLSDSLISYLRDSKASGTGLNEVFCPMAKASWLQKEKDVNNPYMGKSMPSCGSVRHSF